MMLPLLLAAAVAAPAHFEAAPAAAPAAKPQPIKLEKPAIEPKSETACGVMLGAGEKKAPVYKALAGFRILGVQGALTLPKVDGRVEAVRCSRDTIVPADGDGRVLWELRKPLILTDGERTGLLQIGKPEQGKMPQYSFGMIKGTLTEPEKTAVLDRLKILDVRLIAIIRQAQKQQAAAKAADAPIPAKN
jgi:hypothetical protein